jgi:hypothetical protein
VALGAGAVIAGVATVAAFALWPSAREPEVQIPPPPAPTKLLEQVPVEMPERVQPVANPVEHAIESPHPVPLRLPPRPAPTAASLAEHMARLDMRLRKKAAKDPELEEEGLLKLNKMRLRLTGAPGPDDCREVARELDTWEKVYLGR